MDDKIYRSALLDALNEVNSNLSKQARDLYNKGSVQQEEILNLAALYLSFYQEVEITLPEMSGAVVQRLVGDLIPLKILLRVESLKQKLERAEQSGGSFLSFIRPGLLEETVSHKGSPTIPTTPLASSGGDSNNFGREYAAQLTVSKKARQYMNTYVNLNQLVILSGRNRGELLSLLRDSDTPHLDGNTCLLDEDSFHIIFGYPFIHEGANSSNPSLNSVAINAHDSLEKSVQKEGGEWLSASEVQNRFGFASYNAVYQRLGSYGDRIPTKKDGKNRFFFIGPVNSHLLVRDSGG